MYWRHPLLLSTPDNECIITETKFIVHHDNFHSFKFIIVILSLSFSGFSHVDF